MYLTACGTDETETQNAYDITSEPVQSINSPTITPAGKENFTLTREEEEKLGILIKWIYDINIIPIGEDEQSLELPQEIQLLPTDTEKIRFVLDMVVIERLMGNVSDNGMEYTFTEEEADNIIYSAVGTRFDEHKASEYVGDYADGIYSYSMMGGDGATWWPKIDITKVTSISEKEILIEGNLKSVHDVYTTIYSYNFKATAIINQESIFGGYTLAELEIY
jgi:hypothetical protein